MPKPAKVSQSEAGFQPGSGFRLAFTTAPSREEADRIAHALVEKRLAACVNIIEGVASVYRWQGKVEQAQEALLLIKTDVSCIAQVQQLIAELHSYQTPEFLVLAVEGGSTAYLAWLAESLGQ